MTEIHLGSRTLQPRRQFLADGKRIPLGPRALKVLSVLAEAGGEIVTKDELLDAVWPNAFVEENTLQVHIVALRKALGPEAWRLQTIRGVGYQLEPDGLLHETSLADAPSEPHAFPALESGGGTAPASGSTRTKILVVPFANISDDPEQAYFAHGISEHLITDLSKVATLQVFAGLSGQETEDAKEIARRFDASHVLEGSVRKAGKRVRITAQLIEGASGAHVWAERYDREMADIFDLQDDLSQEIVEALKLRLLPGEKAAMEERGTRSPEAYDCFLQARVLRGWAADLDSIRRAPEAYRKALDLDPRFARAWAGLATSLIQNRAHFPVESGITEEQIEEALARAERLAPDLPDVIAGRAQYALVNRDWAMVDECIARFHDMDASDWSIFSQILVARGHTDAAVRHQYRVCRAEPLSSGASLILQTVLGCARRFAEADKEYRKHREMPFGVLASHAMDYEAFKRALAQGDRETARAKLLPNLDNAVLFSHGPDLARVFDDRSKALAILRSEVRDSAGKDPLGIMQVAHLAVFYNADDLALEAVRVANVEIGLTHFTVWDMWHPCFARLHNTPEFKSQLEEIGLVDHCRKTGDWGEFMRPLGETDFEIAVQH